MYCPKCKAITEFYEIDDGPDVDDSQLTYTSYNCEVCNIHLDGMMVTQHSTTQSNAPML